MEASLLTSVSVSALLSVNLQLLKVAFYAKKAVKTRGAVATASLPCVAHEKFAD